MKEIRKTYKFRLYPNKEQRKFLESHFGACRFVHKHFWGKYKNSQLPGKTQLQKELKELKKTDEYSWLNDINSQSLQVSLHNLIRAYKRAFSPEIVKERRKAIEKATSDKQKAKAVMFGFPKFKSKKSLRQSFTVPQNVRLESGKLHIPKLKSGISARLHREVKGTVKQAVILRENDRYYVCLSVIENIEIPQRVFSPVGIDMGLHSFITTSDGEKYDLPHWLEKTEKRLKILQRRLSRKEKGSHRWWKTVLKISRLHEKVKNQRRDFLHKLSIAIAKRYTHIAVESLSVKNMLRNHYLAKSISNAAWNMFLSMLKYKGEWYGSFLYKADNFYPSSKTCSICGYKLDKLPLSRRTWTCPQCGVVHDRDVNAARNLLNDMLSGLERPLDARGGYSVACEAGSLRLCEARRG